MLVTKIGNLVLPGPRTYIEEVQRFESDSFPIANRTEDIGKLLRRIAYSRYPNFAILGPQGIGKTISIDYIVDLITGRIVLDSKYEWFQLVQRTQERAKEYQKRDFLFLPNLQNPFEPYVLDYVEGGIKKAERQARTFCGDVVNFFQQIFQRKEVYPSFREEEFKMYMKDSISNIYRSLYEMLAEIVPHPAEFNIAINDSFSKYTVSVEFLEKRIPYQEIKKELSIMGKKDNKYIRTALKRELKKGINANMVGLFAEMKDIKVRGLETEKKRDVVREIFETVHKNYQELSTLFRENEFEYYSVLQQRLKVNGGMGLRISQESVGWCITQFGNIGKKYIKEDDPKLREWMNFVIKYFTSNPAMLSSLLLENYKKVRNQYTLKKKGKRAGLIYAFFPPEEKSSQDLAFSIQHEKYKLALKDVLNPKVYTQSSESGELCVRYPKELTKKTLLGEVVDAEVEKEEEDEDDYHYRRRKKETEIIPPHLRFKPGYLIDSSVLVMPDNLQAFFRALLGTEEKEAEARRQTILTYFQSGDLIYQEKGITFKVHCPTIVIGSDNENPFLKSSSEKGDEYELDEAMASRFVVAQWDDYIPNTPEARKGTIAVINTAVDNFNRDEHTALKPSPEVIDWFLVSTIEGGSLSLDYRNLDTNVRAALEYAKSMSIREVSLTTIKDYNRSNEPKNRFHEVNARYESMITPPPTKASGAIYGVAFIGEIGESIIADLFPVRSKVIPDKAKEYQSNFCAYDLDAKMVTSSTIKGYEEAVGFIKGQVEEPIRFIVNTSFHRNTNLIHGDSASLATALSLWTAITGEEIYQNRIFTGTVSFFDGGVGPIGKVYSKSLVVWKWHQLMNSKKPAKEYYFIYPAENHRELAQEAVSSSYSLDDIIMTPITSFQEALYLATAEEITDNTFKSLPNKAEEHFQKSKAKLVERVRGINTKVLDAYR